MTHRSTGSSQMLRPCLVTLRDGLWRSAGGPSSGYECRMIQAVDSGADQLRRGSRRRHLISRPLRAASAPLRKGWESDHDRGPEVLNAFILFHNIPPTKTLSMLPSGISRSLGIPKRRGGNAWSTTSKTIVCPAKRRARLVQNDFRPHAGRSAVPIAANTMTV